MDKKLAEEFVDGLYAAKFFLGHYEQIMRVALPDDKFLELKDKLDKCQDISQRTINYFKCNVEGLIG